MITGIIRALVAAGATPEMILAAVEASETDELAREEVRKERDRERTARYRGRGGGKIPDDLRMAVFDRDGWRCLECDAEGNLQCDHATPVSKGGETTLDNLQTLCRTCNARKRDRERKYDRRHAEHPEMSGEVPGHPETSQLVSPKEIPHTPLEITPSPSLRSANQPTRVRASRVPENFVPDVEAAYDAGLSEQETLLEVANFLDYWRSKPTNATKLDWPATWRVWCRKAAKERGSTQGRAPPRQRSQNGFAAFALELDAEQNGPRIINGFSPAEHAGPRSRTREVLEAGRVVDAERPGKAGRTD